MSMFEPDKLNEFDAVIFNNTTNLAFENPVHRQALLDFVKNGKGIVSTHSSVDNFYKWPEGAAMMGALFAGHPWGEAPVKLDDPQHPLLKAFGSKPALLQFYLDGIQYALGDLQADATPSAKLDPQPEAVLPAEKLN